jgi:thioredoxin-like negative regulator of GroEL
MNAYDKLLAQLHAMTASAGHRPPKAKKRHSMAKPERVERAAHAADHPHKKGRHVHGKHKKGRR